MTVNIVVSIVFCISMVILGIYVAITKDFTLISYINQTTIADKHKNQIAYICAMYQFECSIFNVCNSML